MNTIILKGNLGNDPEVKTFESGGQVAKFSLATTERYTNRNNEKVESVDWHNIVFYGKPVDTIEKYLHKGDQVLVTGKVKYRSYDDKEGKTVWVTEVIGDRFEFCGNTKSETSTGDQTKKPGKSGYSDPSELTGGGNAEDDPTFFPE